jgi:hypothetical protein
MEMHLRGVLAQTGPTGILEALLSYNMASVCPDLLTLTKERHRQREGRREEGSGGKRERERRKEGRRKKTGVVVYACNPST